MEVNGGQKEIWIKGKFFKIRREGSNVEIREEGKDYISTAIFPISLARWVLDEMEKLGVSTSEGFVGKQRETNLVGMISIRSNQAGSYLSIFIIPTKSNKSSMALCIPRMRTGRGWKMFKEALESVLPRLLAWRIPNQEQNGETSNQNNMCFEVMGGIEKLLIRKGFEMQAKNLECKAVVACVNNFAYSWKYLIEDLEKLFKFSKRPTISLIGGNVYLIKCDTLKDAEMLVSKSELILDGSRITFKHWHKKMGTIKPYKNPCRWIELIGLSTHLMNREVVAKVCSKFGKVEKIVSVMGIPNQISCIQVLLKDVNVFKIPHFLSVAEQGITHVIRICVSINEIYKPAKNGRANKAGEHDGSLSEPGLPVTETAVVEPVNPIPHQPAILFPEIQPALLFPEIQILNLPIIQQPSPDIQDPSHLIQEDIPVLSYLSKPLQPAFSPTNTVSPSPHRLPPITDFNTLPFVNHSSASPPLPAQPDQTFTLTISSNLPPLHQSVAVATPNTTNPVSLPNPLTDPVPLHKPDEQLAEDDDGMVSDSGDESEHCPENLEVPEIAPQGEELVEFITKKLEIVRKVIDEVEARNLPTSSKQDQANVEGQLVNNEQDQCIVVSEEGYLVNNKEKRKIVTRSARRRKRGALLLQSEEM